MNYKLWDECGEFHGHKCPGLAMGFRASEIALKELGIPLDRSKDEEIICVTENDACGVDAIQWITGCTFGKGNLKLRMTGKHAYSFFDRRTGKSVRVVMKPFARPSSEEREEFMIYILTAPADDIFSVGVPKYGVPEEAKIMESAVCAKCGEAFRCDLGVEKEGKTFCRDCL